MSQTSRLTSGSGYSTARQSGCDALSQMCLDEWTSRDTSHYPRFPTKGRFYRTVIWCSVQQVVAVVQAATASDQDGERKAWSSKCWQFTERPSQMSASRDNSAKAMADLRGHFTLWLWCILTCNVCQGLGSATLKVWQLVDAKYWIIYGRTNKFLATADAEAEWFLMGSWFGNLGC